MVFFPPNRIPSGIPTVFRFFAKETVAPVGKYATMPP